MIKTAATLILMLCFITSKAQDSSIEMADLMRESGKIYVVVGVVVIIFAVLFIYLISLDRKISKIEKGNS